MNLVVDASVAVKWLAHRVSGQVVTADSRFANAIEPTKHAGAVVLLGRQ